MGTRGKRLREDVGKLRIALLTINYRDPATKITPFRSHYQHLHDALAKIEDVVFYGEGHDYNPETNVEKIVKAENPDILFFQGRQERYVNIDKVDVPKFLFCSDPWRNIFTHTAFLNQNKFAGALMLYPCAIPEYVKFTKVKLHPCPYSINMDYYKDLELHRHTDVFCTGSFNVMAHPIRSKLYELHMIYPYTKFKYFLNQGHNLSNKDYLIELNRSKIFCFDNVTFGIPDNDPNAPILQFPIEKWIESFATKTLALAPMPSDPQGLLHLVDGENFVDVTIINFMDKIKYYLEHEKERMSIVENGFKTVKKYHTCEIRAKQLQTIFKETIECHT